MSEDYVCNEDEEYGPFEYKDPLVDMNWIEEDRDLVHLTQEECEEPSGVNY